MLVSHIKGIYICRVRKDPVQPEVIHLVRDNEAENPLPEVNMTVNEIIELWEVNSVFSLDLVGNPKKENRVP